MAKLRSINTGFWDDEYVGDLSRDERYLFLYFLTNPLTNMAGAYKIARRVIRHDTDFTDAELDTILGKFERDGKAVYRDGWIVLTNFLKNQSLNDNMKKGVIADISDAPFWVVQKVLKIIRSSITLSKAFEPFQRLITDVETLSTAAETLRKDELEREREIEDEVEEGEVAADAAPAPTTASESTTFAPGRFDHPAVQVFEETFGFRVGSGFASSVASKVDDLGVWKTLLDNKRAYADKPLDDRKKVCNWILDEYDKRIEEKNGTHRQSYQEQRADRAKREFSNVQQIRQRVAERDRKLLGTSVPDSQRQLQPVESDANGRRESGAV